MATKKVAQPAEVAVQQPQNDSMRVTPMQLAALCFYTSQQYENASPVEKACEANFSPEIINSLVNFQSKGKPEPLLVEVKDNQGNVTGYRVTELGIKWSLKSTSFGINFPRLWSPEVTKNTSALHSALFSLIKELFARHVEGGKPIYYKDKDGNISKFWLQMAKGIDQLEQCLEEGALPEDEE